MANDDRRWDAWWLLIAALLWLSVAGLAGFAAWHFGISEIRNDMGEGVVELQAILLAIVVAAFWKFCAIPLGIVRFYAFEHAGRRLLRLRSNRAATRNFARRSGFDFDGAVRPAYERQLSELKQSVDELVQIARGVNATRETVQICGFDRFENAKHVGEEFVGGRIVVFWAKFTEDELNDLLVNARSESVRVAAQRALDGEEWE